jgi:hypothetical protein
MKNAKRLSLFAVILLGWLSAAYAQVTPTDDAYVNSAAPTTNYGAAATLNLQSAADTSFIRFDLTSVPAAYSGASIAKATLKLYVNTVTTGGSFNVDLVNGTWAEKTITYNLQPAIGAAIDSSIPLTTASKGAFIEIDITPAVADWLNGSPNDGIALVANSPLVATFDSKENVGASHPPEIDIVYAGIAGVATANGSGLTGGGTSGTLNLALTNTCTANQVLKWNGSSWACSAVGAGTITGVTAGTDLTGGGTSGKVTVNLDTTKIPQLTTANSFTGNQTVTGNITATGTISAKGATISGSSGTPILNVTQGGAGQGIVLSSASGSPALQIISAGTTAVQATTSAVPGFAFVGNAIAPSGSTTGVAGNSASSAGSGVIGDAYSTTGNTSGVVGIVASPSGVAGVFNNSAGGSLLLGSNNGVQKFLVDGSGNVTAAGRIASAVATGTPPFNVSSTTQVPNLNASLLGGQAATAFAMLGGNTFTNSQSIVGSVQVDAAGINGGLGTPGVVFGVGASGETISSDRTNVSANFQGLDFYTRSLPRLSVANNGYIGIATTSPQAPLDVAAEGGIRISLTDSALANDNNQIYFLDNGEIRSGDDNHRIIFDRSDNILEMREFGNILFSPGSNSGQRTQTVTFASGGFVGIGTTSPNSLLNVVGSQPGAANSGSGTSAAAVVGVQGGKGGSTSDGTGVFAGTGGSIAITGGDGGDAPGSSLVGTGGTITLQPGAPGGGGGVCYSGGCGNNWGRVLVAPNGGQVGIGTQPCPYGGGCYELLDVGGTAFFNGDVYANGCVLVGAGNVLGGTCYSDARFKKDIRPFAPVLDRLVQITPVSFLWDTEHPEFHFGPGRNLGRSMGVIAQEVEKVFPEMVSTDKNGFKKVNYSELPYLMLQAIRDLKTENDNLRERVAQLQTQQARIDRLEAELERLKDREAPRLAAASVELK